MGPQPGTAAAPASPLARDEAARLERLRALELLEGPPEPHLEALARTARALFGVSACLVSLIDAEFQRIMASCGLELDRLPRQDGLCSHTLALGAPLVVPDLQRDPRFEANRFVTGEAGLRFYAGCPIGLEPDLPLGVLCVVDEAPRSFSPSDLASLRDLAALADAQLRQRLETLTRRRLDAVVDAKDRTIDQQSRDLLRQERLLARASRLARLGAWELDMTDGALHWSEGMYAIHGMQPGERVPSFEEILALYPEGGPRELVTRTVMQSRRDNLPFEVEAPMYTRGGELRWFRLCGDVDMEDGVPVRRYGMKQDIHGEKMLAARTEYLARHDSLTGLPNRTVFLETLESRVVLAPHVEGPGILFIDIDDFKTVNDTHGHQAGDGCIGHIGRRLLGACPPDAVVARLGGDEFGVILPPDFDLVAVEATARQILEDVQQPIEWNGRRFHLGASVGIAFRPKDAQVGAGDMMRQADLALYQVKAAGRNGYRVFTPQMQAQADRRYRVLDEVREALNRGAFTLHYQRKINLADNSHAGFEALVRWRRDGTLVAPGEFLAALEDFELSRRIGDFVIDEALGQAERWRDEGLPFGHIAINLSASQFRDGTLAHRLISRLEQAALEPAMLEVEITEGVLLSRESAEVRQALEALHAYGVRIALDDFGTGFASLSHLRDYPVDVIKIDRSFVANLGTSAQDNAIVGAIILLAVTLGIDVVAEGVETERQQEHLSLLGCTFGQGYLFARPQSAEDCARLLAPVEQRRIAV